MKALLNSMTEGEKDLVRETERDRLEGMEEDDLLELHARIRRARNKHIKLYRREASERVAEYGGRGTARPKNRRNAQKAEVFEDALARVSRYLAAAARRSAAALKAERIQAARAGRSAGPEEAPEEAVVPMQSQRLDRTPKQPVLAKQHASTRAVGARRQGKRDSR
ncbi:hypothetical protein [Spirillospora sp. NPDC029432]|uniref:hypothetical protein n=1 Tax=Spirillospora sp. NPDC029432 TaxID=3154599 RepID=UPI003455E1C0